MHNFRSDPAGAGTTPDPDTPGRHSTLSLVMLVLAVTVIAVIALGFTFWALGFLFSIAAAVLKLVILVGIAALVWRRITRGRARKYDY